RAEHSQSVRRPQARARASYSTDRHGDLRSKYTNVPESIVFLRRPLPGPHTAAQESRATSVARVCRPASNKPAEMNRRSPPGTARIAKFFEAGSGRTAREEFVARV